MPSGTEGKKLASSREEFDASRCGSEYVDAELELVPPVLALEILAPESAREGSRGRPASWRRKSQPVL
jgi:hypothetical protein